MGSDVRQAVRPHAPEGVKVALPHAPEGVKVALQHVWLAVEAAQAVLAAAELVHQAVAVAQELVRDVKHAAGVRDVVMAAVVVAIQDAQVIVKAVAWANAHLHVLTHAVGNQQLQLKIIWRDKK
ncbi:ABC-type enterochelin transport system permease subunit [Clostridiales Family XIII bacterium PM5-7]